jgi:hypothetical protein
LGVLHKGHLGWRRRRHIGTDVGVVGIGVSKDGMTLGHQGFGQELPVVAEANNADFEVVDVVEVGYPQLQFVRHLLGSYLKGLTTKRKAYDGGEF